MIIDLNTVMKESKKRVCPLNIDRVLQISGTFFLNMLSYMSCASISSSLLKQQGFGKLGFYGLALTYFLLAAASPFASALIKKFSPKLAVYLGAFSYFIYILTIFLPTLKKKFPSSTITLFDYTFIWVFVLTFACIKGIGSSFLWVGMQSYVVSCANDKTRGLYFAVFTSTPYAFVGNLLSALILLNSVDFLLYFIIMGGISLTSCILFMFLRSPVRHEPVAP